MNPNYVTIVKLYLGKLLIVRFIELMEQATWLSLIVWPPKTMPSCGFVSILVQMNATIKKDPYPLLFVDKVLDNGTNHEVYLLLDGFFSYHQIQIAFEDCYNMAKLSHIGRLLVRWFCCLGSRIPSTNLSTSS